MVLKRVSSLLTSVNALVTILGLSSVSRLRYMPFVLYKDVTSVIRLAQLL